MCTSVQDSLIQLFLSYRNAQVSHGHSFPRNPHTRPSDATHQALDARRGEDRQQARGDIGSAIMAEGVQGGAMEQRAATITEKAE